MRKVFALFLFSFLVFQFAFAVPGPIGWAGTRLRAEDDPGAAMEWDFGKVKEGVVVKHDFTLKNETPGILKITGINTSCGCTASQAGKQSLAPGESTLINVAFDSKGYSGAVKQFVYVNTDNAGFAVIRFIVKAEVIK